MYPYDTLDDLASTKEVLGTFWSRSFHEQPALDALLLARILLARQTARKATTTFASLSRVQVPTWQEATGVAVSLSAVDATLHPSAYTQGRAPRELLRYPAVAGVASSALLADRPLDPAALLVEGIDYWFDADGRCTLLDDLSAGEAAATLYLRRGRLDSRLVWLHAGSLVGVDAVTSTRYHEFVNALLDSSYQGPSQETLEAALAALTDSPRAKTTGEIVETIHDDGLYRVVLTNQNVYRCARTATIAVTVGQLLTAGTQLTDTVRVLAPPFASIPSDLAQLVVPVALLDPSLAGQLTFQAAAQTITVTTNVAGYTKITWPMPDDPGVVTAFFDLLHSRGVSATKTLANYLDTRPQPQSTQPAATSLPTTVKPLELLLQGVFRNHFQLALIKSSQLGPEALGTSFLSYLGRLLPPEQGLLVVLL